MMLYGRRTPRWANVIVVGATVLLLFLIALVIVPIAAVTVPMIGFMLAGIKLIFRDDDASWKALFGFGSVLLVGGVLYWANLN